MVPSALPPENLPALRKCDLCESEGGALCVLCADEDPWKPGLSFFCYSQSKSQNLHFNEDISKNRRAEKDIVFLYMLLPLKHGRTLRL